MFLLFDIGGTRMRLAVSADGISFGEPQTVLTPQDFEKGMAAFAEAFSKLAGGGAIEAVAGGIAGVLDASHERLLASPNLPLWETRPLKEKIEGLLTTSSIFIENDAALVGLGEAVYGAGKGAKIVAFVTVSTGVGGARIVNGKIDTYTLGFEPGHQIIDADSTICPECKRTEGEETFPGDLESHISGAALKRRFGRDPTEITNQAVWDEVARLLAYGLNNTIVHWSPEVVILGGPLVLEDKISVEAVDSYLRKILRIYPNVPEVKKAQLEDKGGLYGALAYLNQMKPSQ